MLDQTSITPTLRAPLSDEWGAARALLATEGAAGPYAERPLELLDEAASGRGECLAAVALVGGAVVGVVLYGLTAGTEGAGALYGVAVEGGRRGIGSALVAHAAAELTTLRARFVLAEVPDDAPAAGDTLALLDAAGFREEARVADFYRDGVALLFMRRELAGRAGLPGPAGGRNA